MSAGRQVKAHTARPRPLGPGRKATFLSPDVKIRSHLPTTGRANRTQQCIQKQVTDIVVVLVCLSIPIFCPSIRDFTRMSSLAKSCRGGRNIQQRLSAKSLYPLLFFPVFSRRCARNAHTSRFTEPPLSEVSISIHVSDLDSVSCTFSPE